jgi:hypothetical protein
VNITKVIKVNDQILAGGLVLNRTRPLFLLGENGFPVLGQAAALGDDIRVKIGSLGKIGKFRG